MTLYEELLGDHYPQLSPLVQAMHHYEKQKELRGKVNIQRGKSFVAKVLNRLMMLPKEQKEALLVLKLEQIENREKWTRQFGEDSFSSLQYKQNALMVEQMGAVKMYFEVFEKEGSLFTKLKESRIFGLKIPKYFTVFITSEVKEENEKVRFLVNVRTFSNALVIEYDGIIDKEKK